MPCDKACKICSGGTIFEPDCEECSEGYMSYLYSSDLGCYSCEFISSIDGAYSRSYSA